MSGSVWQQLPVGAIIGVVLLFGLLALRRLGSKKWPFKVLQRRGTFQTSKLKAGDMDERKRDFGRTVLASGFYVVAPNLGIPEIWTSSKKSTGNLDAETAEAISSELLDWLKSAIKHTRKPDLEEGVLERCVANVAVSNGVDFAGQNKFPMMMKQPAYVLFVSPTGEIRVLWLSFIADEDTMSKNPSMEAGPYIVRMITADLNSPGAQAAANSQGIACQYSVTEAKGTSMSGFIKKKAGEFSQACLDCNWDEILFDRK